MNDPIPSRLLPQLLLHQRVLVPEQLHRQLIVRRLEERYDLVLEESARRVPCRLLGLVTPWEGGTFLLRGPVETGVVAEAREVARDWVPVPGSAEERTGC